MRAPRDDRVGCTRSPSRSCARLLPASSVENANEVLEALALEIEDAPAQRRQLVVPTTGIVELRRRAAARFDDQSRLDEPFQRAIQRCGPQAHLALTAREDVLHDAVAVLLTLDEAQQNMEPIAPQGQKRFRILLRHDLIYIVTNIYVSSLMFEAAEVTSAAALARNGRDVLLGRQVYSVRVPDPSTCFRCRY